MNIVSNTTPIISLLKINYLYLLDEIYGEITISKGVYNELTCKSSKSLAKEIEKIKKCKFINVRKVTNEFAVNLMQK